jgi:LacI family transcriptional regulator
MFFIPSIIKGISSVLHKEGYHFFVFPQKNLWEWRKKISLPASTRV